MGKNGDPEVKSEAGEMGCQIQILLQPADSLKMHCLMTFMV